jgi:hypothetical protein
MSLQDNSITQRNQIRLLCLSHFQFPLSLFHCCFIDLRLPDSPSQADPQDPAASPAANVRHPCRKITTYRQPERGLTTG